MSDEIRNCEFSFKCPKTWDALEKTPVESQRYCGQCQKIVHHCRSAAELQWAIVRNLCVAVEVLPSAQAPSTTYSEDSEHIMSVGVLNTVYHPSAPHE